MNSKIRTSILLATLSIMLLPLVSAGSGVEFEDGSTMTSLERVTYMSFVGIGLLFIATAFFLFMERNDVARRHRPAIGLGVMIVGIAGFQYALMQDAYVADGTIPTDFRYADWITTVPIMAVTFAILAGKESFTDRRLFSMPGMSVPGIIIIGSLFMMVSGYLGQLELDKALTDGTDPSSIHWYYFFQGMVGYATVFLIVGTPFSGAYGIDDSKISEDSIKLGMSRMRKLVLFGWLIYPLGYILGAIEYGGSDGSALMILVYNIADLVNKFAFVVIVLVAARGTHEALSSESYVQPEKPVEEEYDDSGLLELAEISAGNKVEVEELDL